MRAVCAPVARRSLRNSITPSIVGVGHRGMKCQTTRAAIMTLIIKTAVRRFAAWSVVCVHSRSTRHTISNTRTPSIA